MSPKYNITAWKFLFLLLKNMNTAINANVCNGKQNHFKILHFEDE
jgi:hypothetical protein